MQSDSKRGLCESCSGNFKIIALIYNHIANMMVRKCAIKNVSQGIQKSFNNDVMKQIRPNLKGGERRSTRSYTPLGVFFVTMIMFINSVQSTALCTDKVVRARKYVVKNAFHGVPKRSDYEVVEHDLPPLKDGEILLKTEWVSVDPYLRAYNSFVPAPYDQFSYQIGVVLESKDPNYPVGTRAVTHKGWRDYSVVNASRVSTTDPVELTWKLPDLKGLSPSISIGNAGLTGVSAYFGLLELCQPKEGETVVVTGAAGAVGSIVGQIAKIKGSRVIGFAGSDKKVRWLENELGFDKAINYKTADVQKALKAAAPNGVDCYFDNVGGEISSIIIGQMNKRGRVAVCGSISSYNEDSAQLPKASILQPSIVINELRIEGFLAYRWLDRWPEAMTQLITWIKGGLIKQTESVTVGFDKLFDAFVGMLAGQNNGKAVVKI